jgi:protein-arginine deiminase
LVSHHLQWGTEAYALQDDRENKEFVEGFEDALGDEFSGYRMSAYGYDVWVQDEFEFATLTAPDIHMDVVIDSVRIDNGTGLDDLPEDEWEAPDVAVETWRGRNRVTSQDSFGNLEVTPPVTVDGIDYPFGRVYWGLLNDTWGIAPDLADLFISQGIQDPFQVDIDFVCVGHVDEFSSWVPDSSSEKGFKLLISDTDAAYEFLQTLDPNTSLPRYAEDHGYSTIGEILNDNSLWSLQEEIQEDYLDPNLDIFMSKAGLTEDDVIRIPGIFEEYPGCQGSTLALIPGTVNMEVYQPEGSEITKLIIPDPFLRSNNNDQDSDPFIEHVNGLLPENVETWWVDDWDSYHLWMGEVHCGSNTLRAPAADWWTDAAHLLEPELVFGGAR